MKKTSIQLSVLKMIHLVLRVMFRKQVLINLRNLFKDYVVLFKDNVVLFKDYVSQLIEKFRKKI